MYEAMEIKDLIFLCLKKEESFLFFILTVKFSVRVCLPAFFHIVLPWLLLFLDHSDVSHCEKCFGVIAP